MTKQKIGMLKAAQAEASRVAMLDARPKMNAFEGQRQSHVAAFKRYEEGMISRGDERIARGMAGIRTKKAHLYCAGGCGTTNPNRCGGRWWANRYKLSLVCKNDATHRIAVGEKRAARIKIKGV
jgi:hypothetical protein